MGTKKIDKTRLIKIATDLFNLGGYSDTSMADIAAKCNINKASLYHHFASKQDLTIAVLKHWLHSFQEGFLKIAYEEGVDKKARLGQLLEKLEHFFMDSEGGCLMANLTLEIGTTIPEFTSIFKAYFESWINAIAHLLEPFQGKVRAKQSAEEIVAEFEGMLMLTNLFQDSTLLRRQRDRLLASLTQEQEGSIA